MHAELARIFSDALRDSLTVQIDQGTKMASQYFKFLGLSAGTLFEALQKNHL